MSTPIASQDAEEDRLRTQGYQPLYDLKVAKAIWDGGVDVGTTDALGRRWPLERCISENQLRDRHGEDRNAPRLHCGKVVWFPGWSVELHSMLVRDAGLDLYDFTRLLLQLKKSMHLMPAVETLIRLGSGRHAVEQLLEEARKT